MNRIETKLGPEHKRATQRQKRMELVREMGIEEMQAETWLVNAYPNGGFISLPHTYFVCLGYPQRRMLSQTDQIANTQSPRFLQD